MKRETFESILTDIKIKNRPYPPYDHRTIRIVTNTRVSCGGYSTGQQIFNVECENIDLKADYIKFPVKGRICTVEEYAAWVYLPYENIAFVFDGQQMN